MISNIEMIWLFDDDDDDDDDDDGDDDDDDCGVIYHGA